MQISHTTSTPPPGGLRRHSHPSCVFFSEVGIKRKMKMKASEERCPRCLGCKRMHQGKKGKRGKARKKLTLSQIPWSAFPDLLACNFLAGKKLTLSQIPWSAFLTLLACNFLECELFPGDRVTLENWPPPIYWRGVKIRGPDIGVKPPRTYGYMKALYPPSGPPDRWGSPQMIQNGGPHRGLVEGPRVWLSRGQAKTPAKSYEGLGKVWLTS